MPAPPAGRPASPIIATSDDRDGRDRERDEPGVAGQEHPGHRDHDGEPGDHHRPPRGRRGDCERVLGGAPGRPLLALTAHVEERVVDADGEPDQQDQRVRVAVEREQLARDRDQGHRRQHGRQREKQRHAGGDQRPERDQEDDERHRQGDHPGLAEVTLDRVVERLLGASAAELVDLVLGVEPPSARRSSPRSRRALSLMLFLATDDLELDERRVAVLRDAAAVAVSSGEAMFSTYVVAERLGAVCDHGLERRRRRPSRS